MMLPVMQRFGFPGFDLIITLFLTLTGSALATHAPRDGTWPNGPFVTSGRWITDASGVNVTYAGVNWPASADVMIPEGLQYRSIEDIVSKIKSLGMNSIRLTYAIEMIDQIYDNENRDITVYNALVDAIGDQNGSAVYDRIVEHNPSFNRETTRLEIFDAVAAECAKQEIYVHLDNHVSKAGWCCFPDDGNAWWGDTYFSVENWLRGLTYMADHGKDWPNLMSMSLRNELRQPLSNISLFRNSYNWEDWYSYVRQGAGAINKANPNVLIFLSGLDSDATLEPVVQGEELKPGTATFKKSDFNGYADKLVLELHMYLNINGPGPSDCNEVKDELFSGGFQALTDNAHNRFPVMMTEFGFGQDNQSTKTPYVQCLMDYLVDQKAGWMIWALSGSYYIRQGKEDADEPWGLLTHDWSSWRASDFVEDDLIPMVNNTKAGLSLVPSGEKDPSDGGSSDDGGSNDENSGVSLGGLVFRFGGISFSALLLLVAVLSSLLIMV